MLNITKYRIYPGIQEEQMLNRTLKWCSYVRNIFVESGSLDKNWLPIMKREFPELKDVHSKVLQNVVIQLQHNRASRTALAATGRKVGKARLKPQRSIIYDQSGFELNTEKNILWLSKIGEMSIEISRETPGKIKQIIVKRQKRGTWFVSVVADDGEPCPEMTTGKTAVGIDRNLLNFSTDSDGLEVDIQKNYRKIEPQIKHAQREMGRKVKKSENWYKARREVARLYGKAFDRRKDFHHKLSRYYVDNYDLVALEDLRILNMVRNRRLSKGILDAAWGQFGNFVKYKAARAGKHFVLVNPAHTSDETACCGSRISNLTLKERHIQCPSCGARRPRDYNAALNIKQRALDKVGWGTAEPAILDRHMLAEFGTTTLSGCVPGLQVPSIEAGKPWTCVGQPTQVQEFHAL